MHAPVKPSQSPAYRAPGIGLVLRLAIRDLRAGLRGFGIFIACLALGVMTIGGVQLIMIGIVGEYIGKILSELKARPIYFVAEHEVKRAPPRIDAATGERTSSE